jgi:hypothetical protein
MPTVIKRFSAAARAITSADKPMRECIYAAYFIHLDGIEADDLPDQFQLIYDSVKLRLTAVITHGTISDDEAGYIAADILYLAESLHSNSTI